MDDAMFMCTGMDNTMSSSFPAHVTMSSSFPAHDGILPSSLTDNVSTMGGKAIVFVIE